MVRAVRAIVAPASVCSICSGLKIGRRFASEIFGRSDDSIGVIGFMPVPAVRIAQVERLVVEELDAVEHDFRLGLVWPAGSARGAGCSLSRGEGLRSVIGQFVL
jgi:hypothetical protein